MTSNISYPHQEETCHEPPLNYWLNVWARKRLGWIKDVFLYQRGPETSTNPDFSSAEEEAEYWANWPIGLFQDTVEHIDAEPNDLYGCLNFDDSNGSDGSQSLGNCGEISPPLDHGSSPLSIAPSGTVTPIPASPTLMENARKTCSLSPPATVLDQGDSQRPTERFIEESGRDQTPAKQKRLCNSRRSRRLITKPSNHNSGHNSSDDESESDFLDSAIPPHHTRAGPSRRMASTAASRSAGPQPRRVYKPRTKKAVLAVKESSRRAVYTIDPEVSKSVRAEYSRLDGNLPVYMIKLPTDTGVKDATRWRCNHVDEEGKICTGKGSATDRQKQAERHALTHHNLRWLCGNPNCRQLFARIDPVKRHMDGACKDNANRSNLICVAVDEVRLLDGEYRVFAAHPVTHIFL